MTAQDIPEGIRWFYRSVGEEIARIGAENSRSGATKEELSEPSCIASGVRWRNNHYAELRALASIAIEAEVALKHRGLASAKQVLTEKTQSGPVRTMLDTPAAQPLRDTIAAATGNRANREQFMLFVNTMGQIVS